MPSNRLVNANQSVRCHYIKVNGLRCGSPARHGRNLCCFHDSAAQRNRDFVLPIIEDAGSLQLALNKVLQALVDKLIDQKAASTLLYGLQIAQANLRKLEGERRVDASERADEFRRRQQREPERVAHAPSRVQPGLIGNRQSTIGNAVNAPDHPTAQPDLVRDLLREMTNRQSPAVQSQITGHQPLATDHSQSDHPVKIDIKACAEETVH
jgi:hypothetical protein